MSSGIQADGTSPLSTPASRLLSLILTVCVLLGTLSGLFAAYKRLHVEARNRRVEIGMEWQDVSALAQASHHTVAVTLAQLKAQHLSALIVQEETLDGLQTAGALQKTRIALPGGGFLTRVDVDSAATLQRIRAAFALRGIAETVETSGETALDRGTTFRVTRQADPTGQIAPFHVASDYVNNLGRIALGLPQEAVQAAQQAGLAVVGRVGNFPGLTQRGAQAILQNLRRQGAHLVIFNGDEVLGYRGLEKKVAAMLRSAPDMTHPDDPTPVGLLYGAVEFSKQKGDETLTGALHGDFVRVHSVQAAEMGTLSENDLIERFDKAVRERNIRFCYVRPLTLTGEDPLRDNAEYLRKITRGMEQGGALTGGGLKFGVARPYEETFSGAGVPRLVFALIALGVAAGTVWMLRAFCPLPEGLSWHTQTTGVGIRGLSWLLLIGITLLCSGLCVVTGESGRQLVALLAGIAFPAVACLRVFPRAEPGSGRCLPVAQAMQRAVRGLVLASGITFLGIVQVVGLLATRPFMVRASQFLGIKAQHAVPIGIVALAAILGGATLPGETWQYYKQRAEKQLRFVLDEPLRIGLLLLGIVALAALILIVARTGNDSGVGVSGAELEGRSFLDRVLPVRPRTKEFLVGHPLFVLGLAWWWRGRRRLALPCFVAGSIGQVSLLNTFCHIHTPLVISLWRDLLGLILGGALGLIVFLLLEKMLPEEGAGARIRENDPEPIGPLHAHDAFPNV